MKKKGPRKLALTRETLADLHRTDLGAVAGGTYSNLTLVCFTCPQCILPNTV